jgi:predicted secreted protein
MSPVAICARSLWTTIAGVIVVSGLAIALGVAFRLSVVGAIGLYFVVWWILLFAILPLRVETQAERGEIAAGTDPGAPAAPALREKALWTTALSSLVFVLIAALFPLSGL